MTEKHDAIRVQFETLLQGYIAELPNKLQHTREIWERLPEDHWNPAGWHDYHRLIHSLAGSGAIYGFPMISAAARALDIQLKALILEAHAPDPAQRKQLAALLDLIGLAAREAQRTMTSPVHPNGLPPAVAEQPSARAPSPDDPGHRHEQDATPLQSPPADWLQAAEQDHDVEADANTRILIVDDDPQFRQFLMVWLKMRGFQVEVAASGEEALARLESTTPPDLVFLDVLLPGISGLQALELIRDQIHDMAIILTTAFGSEPVAINALRRGADDYLRKPFDTREFQAILQRTLDRLRLRRQNTALRAQLDEKHRQLEAELSRAARIQAELLPTRVPKLAGFELAARCIPAREVGGDFYDWHQVTPSLLNLTMGDVMGKGMPAALLMTTVRATMRAVAGQNAPSTTIHAMSSALDADLSGAGSFVTLFHAQLDIARRRLAYIDAGHGHVFVRRANGTAVALTERGVPLGIMSNPAYQEGCVDLQPGDALVLYSDGLVDMWPLPEHHRGILADMLADTHGAQQMVDRLVTLPSLLGPLEDDLTVVVLYCYAP
ncbi:MAG TPA: SpoIIE family protein phosphatase [Roseiflexaceae bacterium]|nr:SpoIIE family protein phosphatase [Roseiflexaceae bacterium]